MQAAQDGQLSQAAVPRVYLHASENKALNTVSYKDLKKYSADSEAGESGRQENSHDPNEHRGIAKTSKEIGGDQPSIAPGAGKWQGNRQEVTPTDGSRG